MSVRDWFAAIVTKYRQGRRLIAFCGSKGPTSARGTFCNTENLPIHLQCIFLPNGIQRDSQRSTTSKSGIFNGGNTAADRYFLQAGAAAEGLAADYLQTVRKFQ